ncbi:MAG: universal stress protein [bacterium]
MKILVLTDGSEGAQKSTRFAVKLFQFTSHEIKVVVFKSNDKELPEAEEERIGADRALEEIKTETDEIVGDSSNKLTDVEVLTDRGNLMEYIDGVADDYDLVCLGTAGKGAFTENVLGEVPANVIRYGRGNLLINKGNDSECRRSVICAPLAAFTEELAEFVIGLFTDFPGEIVIYPLLENYPRRFEGYRDASGKKKVEEMVEDEVFPHDHERLDQFVKILESEDFVTNFKFCEGTSTADLIDGFTARDYDLIIIHAPGGEHEFLPDFEPGKQMLQLVRKSPTNTLVLRDVPGIKDVD